MDLDILMRASELLQTQTNAGSIREQVHLNKIVNELQNLIEKGTSKNNLQKYLTTITC